ncbi:serine/threonine-protein kinase [Actinomadura atramentaria]|uniref:serine/threonine-protein kinase n=1 Tax=Actinomadura atramentaria TaxID=1990 RepID=UPI00035C9C58|nr:serine/threonine-protein kinase [Actinomadura atramentaria]
MKPLLHDDPVQIGVHVLMARIGAGGMGVVYLARSPGGRLVALKAVHAELASDPAFRARFAREVEASRAVGGAFTAPLVDADPVAPRPWLATVYLPGVPLGEAVEATGPLPGPAVDALGAGIAEALVSIHRAGVAHRDLKPSNVLLTRDGPRLIDLGIAAVTRVGDGAGDGTVLGSPGYLAPEQAAGGDGGPAADVFALGAVLAFAATGRGPYQRGSADAPPAALLYRVLNEEPDLSGIDDVTLRDLVGRCLRRDPDERPDASTVLDAFAARLPATDGVPERSGGLRLPGAVVERIDAAARFVPRPGAPPWREARPPAPPGVKRRRVLFGLLAAGGAVVVGGATTAAVLASRGGGEEDGLVWKTTLPDQPDVVQPVGGTLLCISRDSGTTGLDARTGKRRWRNSSLTASGQSMVLAAGNVGIVTNLSDVQAVDAATGRSLWSTSIAGRNVPAVAPNVVCVSGVREAVAETSTIAYDPKSGATLWKLPSSYQIAGGTVAGGVAFVPVEDGKVRAVDAVSGAKHWEVTLAPEENASTFAVMTPVAAGDAVFVPAGDNRLHCFGAADGKERWKAELSGALTYASDTPDCCIAAGDAVFTMTAEGMVQCFEAASGKQRWRLPTGYAAHRPLRDLLHVSGDVALMIARRTLVAVGLADGRERWRQEMGVEPLRAVLGGGLLHLDSIDGLRSVDPATGRIERTLNGDPYSLHSDPYVVGNTLVMSGYPHFALAVPCR